MRPNTPLDITRRPSLDFTSRASQFAPDALPLVSFLWQPVPARPPANPNSNKEIAR